MFRFSIFISTVLLICCLNDCVGHDTLSSYVLCNPVSSDQPHSSPIAQGPPGKKGPRGEKGEIGPKGHPGNKGERDARNRNELAALTRRIDELTSTVASLQNAGWTSIGTYWYRTSPAKLSWSESRVYCLAVGGDLATAGMRNAETRRLMYNQKFLNRRENYWFGMNDIDNEGTWVWIDGVRKTSSNTNFAPGEPNNLGLGTNADCAQMYSSGLMDDVDCSHHLAALCEKN